MKVDCTIKKIIKKIEFKSCTLSLELDETFYIVKTKHKNNHSCESRCFMKKEDAEECFELMNNINQGE